MIFVLDMSLLVLYDHVILLMLLVCIASSMEKKYELLIISNIGDYKTS